MSGTIVRFHPKTSLEIFIFDELDDDVLLRLDLQHLEREAEKGCGLDVSTVNSTNILQLHGFVNNQLSCGQYKVQINTVKLRQNADNNLRLI